MVFIEEIIELPSSPMSQPKCDQGLVLRGRKDLVLRCRKDAASVDLVKKASMFDSAGSPAPQDDSPLPLIPWISPVIKVSPSVSSDSATVASSGDGSDEECKLLVRYADNQDDNKLSTFPETIVIYETCAPEESSVLSSKNCDKSQSFSGSSECSEITLNDNEGNEQDGKHHETYLLAMVVCKLTTTDASFKKETLSGQDLLAAVNDNGQDKVLDLKEKSKPKVYETKVAEVENEKFVTLKVLLEQIRDGEHSLRGGYWKDNNGHPTYDIKKYFDLKVEGLKLVMDHLKFSYGQRESKYGLIQRLVNSYAALLKSFTEAELENLLAVKGKKFSSNTKKVSLIHALVEDAF